MFRFLSGAFFAGILVPGGFPLLAGRQPPPGATSSHFLLAFDSNMAPIVGQQVTLDRSSRGAELARVDLLLQRAAAGSARWWRRPSSPARSAASSTWRTSGSFAPTKTACPPIPDGLLRLAALLKPVTYTAVPVGSGQRIGLDSDLDGCYDVTEDQAGYDPRNPGSRPSFCG